VQFDPQDLRYIRRNSFGELDQFAEAHTQSGCQFISDFRPNADLDPCDFNAWRIGMVTVANYLVPEALKAAIGVARMKSPSEEPSSSISDC
jgi:hypothetical protein